MNGFEEGVEFLPVNNAKKVEKRGPRRWLVLVALLTGLLLLSLVVGLLVWHFQCEYSWAWPWGGRYGRGSPSSHSAQSQGPPVVDKRKRMGKGGGVGRSALRCRLPGLFSAMIGSDELLVRAGPFLHSLPQELRVSWV